MYLDGTTLLSTGIFDEPFDIERIEIIRGPSGTVFGPGNFGGLANRVSKQPEFTAGGTAQLVFGNDGEMKEALDLTGPIPGTNNTLAYRVVATYSRGPFSDKIDDHYIEDFIHTSLTWKPGPDTTLTVNVKYRDMNAILNLMGDYLQGTTFSTLYKFNTNSIDPLASSPYTTNYKETMAWFVFEQNVGSWLSLRTLGAVEKERKTTNMPCPRPAAASTPTPFMNGASGTSVPLPAGMLNGVYDWYAAPFENSGGLIRIS